MSSAKAGVLQLAPQAGEQAQCYIDLARLLVTGTRSFYNNPTFSDITLVCPDGRQLRCHQIILAASSKRLASVLKQGTFTNSKLPVQGVDSTALDTLIDSFYTGECPLTLATAASIYDAALKLEVNGLPDAVVHFVGASLTSSNACLLLDRAITAKTGRLAELCLDFVRGRLGDVMMSPEFSSSNIDVVAHICTDIANNRHPLQVALQVAVAWLRGPPSGPGRMHLLPSLADLMGISPDILQTFMRNMGNSPNAASRGNSAGGGGNNGGNGGGGVSLMGDPPTLDGSLTLNSLPLLQLLPAGQLQQLGMSAANAGGVTATQMRLGQGKVGGTTTLRNLLEDDGGGGGLMGMSAEGAVLAQKLGTLRRELEEGAAAGGFTGSVTTTASVGARGKRARTEDGRRNSGWEQEPLTTNLGRGVSDDQELGSPSAAAGGVVGGGFAGGLGPLALPASQPSPYSDPAPRDRRTPQVKGVCHVEGCYADLTGLRDYHLRYKICEFHLKVSSVLKDGVPQRFCQQCGRFHHLSEFDGSRRSCRTMLARHNMRRAKKMGQGGSPVADDGGGNAAAAANSGGNGSAGADLSVKLMQQLGTASLAAAMASLGASGQQQQGTSAQTIQQQQQQQLAQLTIPDGMSLTDAVAAAMATLQGNGGSGSAAGGGGSGLLGSTAGRRLSELLDGFGRTANGGGGGVQVGSLFEAMNGAGPGVGGGGGGATASSGGGGANRGPSGGGAVAVSGGGDAGGRDAGQANCSQGHGGYNRVCGSSGDDDAGLVTPQGDALKVEAIAAEVAPDGAGNPTCGGSGGRSRRLHGSSGGDGADGGHTMDGGGGAFEIRTEDDE